MTQDAYTILNQTFGYSSFRCGQAEIIQHMADGGDALVIMPTGGGKSLCFQIPAMLRPGVGIVVSPLIALMRDQVGALQQLGVRAAFLNSTLSLDENRLITRYLLEGELNLLYVAPERLCTDSFLGVLSGVKIALFAIDEAHCVSQWGHDFRPEYSQLSILQQKFPDVPRIALTATADSATREEVIQRLQLSRAKQYITGFDRPNIQYRIHLKNSPKQQLLKFLRREHEGDSGIVYCLSRKRVENTADWLCSEGYDALPYHAGLPAQVRDKNQKAFLQRDGVIVVATIAFGMGIDKPDVRFVAHLDLPKSVEAYYQETGRAGRDGLPATAWMVYSFADVIKLRQMINQSEGPQQFIRLSNQKLNALLGICEAAGCRRQLLLRYFGDTLEAPCQNCDACLSPADTYDGTIDAQKAMSCVVRTGQQFGAGHLIDVLRGMDNDKVRRKKHHLLPTFGCGKNMSVNQWQSVYRQLVAADLLSVDFSGYGGLRITKESWPVLQGKKKVIFRKDPIMAPEKRKVNVAAKRSSIVEISGEADQYIFEKLKNYRTKQALQQNLPAYTIFHNATLEKIAIKKPSSLLELSDIPGIGAHKLERYGADILEILGRTGSQ